MMPLLFLRGRNHPVVDWSFLGGSLPSGLSFTRAGGATRFDASGVMQSMAADQPRFDYDPVTLAPRGLLMEPLRQNVFLNSETPATQSISVTATVYTVSFYGSGTITLSGAHSATVTGIGAYPSRKTYAFTPSAGTLTLTISGNVQKGQLEAGAFATSYIQTGATSVTRAAESLLLNGLPWFNANAGTFWVEADLLGPYWSNTLADFNDTTANNTVALYGKEDNTVSALSTSAGVVTYNNSSAVTPNVPFKAALRYVSGNNRTSVNGTLVTSTTNFKNGNVPVGITRLSLMRSVGGNNAGGHLRRFKYWARDFTDDELQRITA